MSKTTKSSSTKGQRTFKASAFHSSVFAHPKAKRCLHESKAGKVCKRFAGHEKKGRVGHFYVTAKELKAAVSAWAKRFA